MYIFYFLSFCYHLFLVNGMKNGNNLKICQHAVFFTQNQKLTKHIVRDRVICHIKAPVVVIILTQVIEFERIV